MGPFDKGNRAGKRRLKNGVDEVAKSEKTERENTNRKRTKMISPNQT